MIRSETSTKQAYSLTTLFILSGVSTDVSSLGCELQSKDAMSLTALPWQRCTSRIVAAAIKPTALVRPTGRLAR